MLDSVAMRGRNSGLEDSSLLLYADDVAGAIIVAAVNPLTSTVWEVG